MATDIFVESLTLLLESDWIDEPSRDEVRRELALASDPDAPPRKTMLGLGYDSKAGELTIRRVPMPKMTFRT